MGPVDDELAWLKNEARTLQDGIKRLRTVDASALQISRRYQIFLERLERYEPKESPEREKAT